MKFQVRDLVKATKGELVSGYPGTACPGRLSIDTRTITPGDIFVALQGPRFDGHQFMQVAAQKGARAALIQRVDANLAMDPDENPDLVRVPDTLVAIQDIARAVRSQCSKTKFVGLTGSNGKTTTKEMLASILRRAGKTLSTRGNLNNHIGLPLMMTELESDHEYAVLEMGTSKKGDMDLLVDVVRPDVGIITNVGKDHLEFLDTPEGVLEVNRKLYDALPPSGTAVINLEDPLLKRFAQELSCRKVTYGRVPEALVSAQDVKPAVDSLTFTLRLDRELLPVKLGVIGEVQVLNAMAAAAVAFALGISGKTVVEGLEAFRGVPMRMEVKALPDGTVLVNDAYNANPSSMRASIESFCRTYAGRPRWVVLGDMRELGPTLRQEHEDLGRWAASLGIDRFFFYGRDMRFALQGVVAAGKAGVADRFRKKRLLLQTLQNALQSGAKPAILFKASRSLKLEQVIHALLTLPS